jgi:hypothetical protein
MIDLIQDTEAIKQAFREWIAKLESYVQRGIVLGTAFLQDLQRYADNGAKREKAQRNTENVLEALQSQATRHLAGMRQYVEQAATLRDLQENLEFYELGYQITELSAHWKLRTYVVGLLMKDHVDAQTQQIVQELTQQGTDMHEDLSEFTPYRELQLLYKKYENMPRSM